MPVVDSVAQEFVGEVDVIAVAWRSSYSITEAAAGHLLPSGVVRWAMDEEGKVFGAFAVPGQPTTVLVAGGVELGRWFGARGEDEIRAAMEMLSQY